MGNVIQQQKIYKGDRHSVEITVRNVGATVTGYDVWMTWLTTS